MSAVATYNCPFCSERKGTPDTKGHLYSYGPGKGYHCFRCEAHSGSGDLPANVGESASFGDDATLPSADQDNPAERAEPAWQYARARLYLMERGLTAEDAEKYHVLYSVGGWLQGRVIFPIFGTRNGRHEMAYFVARAIDSWRTPKYINAPWGKNGLVYPVGILPADVVVVVEGIFDAFAVERAGWPAVSLLGKRVNAGQARLIAALGKRAVVLLDDDAFSSSLEAAYILGHYLPTVRCTLGLESDPGGTDREALRNLIAKRIATWPELKTTEAPRFKRSHRRTRSS